MLLLPSGLDTHVNPAQHVPFSERKPGPGANSRFQPRNAAFPGALSDERTLRPPQAKPTRRGPTNRRDLPSLVRRRSPYGGKGTHKGCPYISQREEESGLRYRELVEGFRLAPANDPPSRRGR